MDAASLWCVLTSLRIHSSYTDGFLLLSLWHMDIRWLEVEPVASGPSFAYHAHVTAAMATFWLPADRSLRVQVSLTNGYS